ncbi:MAG TPA: hypothetical protein VHK69_15155, partial [Chitinophagaceae bacterium]|nr:hypothetical protein [Chitinophagaceae bacterium]
MKRIVLAIFAMGVAMAGFSQTDSTKTSEQQADTIRVGGVVIVRKGGKDDNDSSTRNRAFSITSDRKKKRNDNVSTNWWIVDLGFANVNDKTMYGTGEAASFAPGLTDENFKLRTGKSVNVNVWFFMQKLNLVKHVVNLKYGLGLELNNYRFDD